MPKSPRQLFAERFAVEVHELPGGAVAVMVRNAVTQTSCAVEGLIVDPAGKPLAFRLAYDHQRDAAAEDLGLLAARILDGSVVPEKLPLSTIVRRLGLDGSEPAIVAEAADLFRRFLIAEGLAERARFERQIEDGGGIRVEVDPGMEAMLRRAEQAEFARIDLGAVASALDSEVLSVLRCAQEYSTAAYEFYRDPARSKFRLQAGKAYPILAAEIARPVRMSWRKAIDAGQPLEPVMIRGLGIGKAVVKRLSGQEGSPRISEGALVRALSQLPPDWAPSSPGEWEAFGHVVEVVQSALHPVTGMDMTRAAEGSGGKWSRLLDKLCEAAGAERPPAGADPRDTDILNAAQGVRDMVRSFTERVVMPLSANMAEALRIKDFDIDAGFAARADEAARAVLFDGRNAITALEMSRRWHREEIRVEAATFKPDPTLCWPALVSDVIAPNGYRITSLCTPQALADEGTRMNHCVGGYNRSASMGACHILSIRDPGGKSVGTLEISGTDGVRNHWRKSPEWVEGFAVLQFQGVGNRRPHSDAREAWDWFTVEVRSKRIRLNTAELAVHVYAENDDYSRRRAGVARPRPTDPLSPLCGYDWRDEKAIYRAYRAWTGNPLPDPDAPAVTEHEKPYPYLPKKIRKGDIYGLMAHPAMEAAARAIDPLWEPADRGKPDAAEARTAIAPAA